jgi:hypothetical protein
VATLFASPNFVNYLTEIPLVSWTLMRDGIISSLKSILGPEFAFATTAAGRRRGSELRGQDVRRALRDAVSDSPDVAVRTSLALRWPDGAFA